MEKTKLLLRLSPAACRHDNPYATKFNLHILAAVAEFGRDAISRRTKEALGRREGARLAARPEIGKGNRAAADALAESLREIVTPLAGQTTRAIAQALNDRGVKTVRGGQWQSPQVMRLLDRIGL